MDASHFEREYDKMGEGSKKIVVEGLKKTDKKEAKLKLALLTDFGEIEKTEDKNVALKDLTFKQIKDVIENGTETQKQEFIKAVSSDIDKFSDTIKDQLKNGTPVSDSLKAALKIKT